MAGSLNSSAIRSWRASMCKIAARRFAITGTRQAIVFHDQTPRCPASSRIRKKDARGAIHCIRLGRQLADHFGLEPEMLWVRIPLEPLMERQAGKQECTRGCSVQRSARLASNQLVSVRIRAPVLDDNLARYANWQSGEAQTFVSLWVRLPPAPLHSQVVELVDTRFSDDRALAACEFESRLGYSLQV